MVTPNRCRFQPECREFRGIFFVGSIDAQRAMLRCMQPAAARGIYNR
ncbi:hypothetical protein K6W16_02170 [Burkholderia dolosa]|uniref:Uncharacterized protein n=1 Tax=Burkholderia dolosa TaxID=152500 RepID=A0A892I642_9BURK|nr:MULTISPECIES: hypothetical protein [Burkholderia]MBR8060715.1 hypothetical protein [Burkholderia dolosa]MBY4689369.1 hypothetical protein [Burkholderia dolosa]MBY4787014.1 hypothetical protein [Burkholderia dolosa]MBY4841815.1 hypothetical protein [Burkholderia dolosa]MBY4914479.1 hypothetical protein [Burkholderia dolosa]